MEPGGMWYYADWPSQRVWNYVHLLNRTAVNESTLTV